MTMEEKISLLVAHEMKYLDIISESRHEYLFNEYVQLFLNMDKKAFDECWDVYENYKEETS